MKTKRVLRASASPKFNRAAMQAREVAAIATIRTLHTAETRYNSTFGRYAISLQQLSKPTSGAAPAFNGTGVRAFFSDQSQETHQHAGAEPATASDPAT